MVRETKRKTKIYHIMPSIRRMLKSALYVSVLLNCLVVIVILKSQVRYPEIASQFLSDGNDSRQHYKIMPSKESKVEGKLGQVTVEVLSAGFDDHPDDGFSSIKVNGTEYSPQKRGHNMVVIDYYTGAVKVQGNFDTYADRCADCLMASFIASAPSDSIIVVSVMDDGSFFINKSLSALRAIGAIHPLRPSFRGSWAFIGYKGQRLVDWVQQEATLSTEGACKIKKTIKLLGSQDKPRKDPDPNHGRLTHHFWHDTCGHVTDVLRRNTTYFPFKPSCRCLIQTLETDTEWLDYTGQRIYGFIHPPVTGEYRFGIAGDDCADLWLSKSEDPQKAELLASVGRPGMGMGKSTQWGQFAKFESQLSKIVTLEHGKKYFIDVLQKQETGISFVQVRWILPGKTVLEEIESSNLSGYSHEGDIYKIPTDVPSYIYDPVIEFDNRLYLHTLPLLPRVETDGILPSCEYNPSYLFHRKMEKSEGCSFVEEHETLTYPDDYTTVPLNGEVERGNNVIKHHVVNRVVSKFFKMFRAKHGSKYMLKQIANVELQPDPEKGNRFLIELELMDTSKDQTFRLSRYVYEKKTYQGLCYPNGFDWDPAAPVSIIVPVKNQASWLKMFLKDMYKNLKELNDTGVRIIVVDYNSSDADIRDMMAKSGLDYTLIQKGGKWSKTLAISSGAKEVKNPNNIIFLADLHIDYPITLLDNIRKHTIKGKMVYSPMVLRLNCGYTSEQPNGYWELYGFGLVGTYKRDWDNFGGINTQDYGEYWGGEDNDMMDRILGSGFEAHRLRLQHLFHHFHTHDGMWQLSN